MTVLVVVVDAVDDVVSYWLGEQTLGLDKTARSGHAFGGSL